MLTGRAIRVTWLSTAAFVLAATFTGAAMTPRRTTVDASALTRTVMRPPAQGLDALIVFGETRPGSPRTISAWYPAGDSIGRAFLH